LEGKYFEKVKHYLQLSHFNDRGKRKGCWSHASSASAMPQSFISVAAHGEWSIGKIRMFILSLLWDEINTKTKWRWVCCVSTILERSMLSNCVVLQLK
jgi:hypothetical protein